MVEKQELEIHLAPIQTALTIIEEERATREQKTARLRALRLAKERQEAQTQGRSRRKTKDVHAKSKSARKVSSTKPCLGKRGGWNPVHSAEFEIGHSPAWYGIMDKATKVEKP